MVEWVPSADPWAATLPVKKESVEDGCPLQGFVPRGPRLMVTSWRLQLIGVQFDEEVANTDGIANDAEIEKSDARKRVVDSFLPLLFIIGRFLGARSQ